MSGSDLKEVLKEVKLVRKKVERLEELVEERLVGSEPPSDDEVEAIKEYINAKKKKAIPEESHELRPHSLEKHAVKE